MLLTASQESHARFVMGDEKRKDKKELIGKIAHRPAVIFGCGIRGERLMHFCTINQIDIHSFCDNNRALHGGKKFGFPVIAPSDLKRTVDGINGVVLLSMEHGREDVYGQLTELGVGTDRIIGHIPAGVLY